MGSLLRDRLFANGAVFAACVVAHPTDEQLSISITAPNAKQCLLLALRDVESDLRTMSSVVDAHIACIDAMDTCP